MEVRTDPVTATLLPDRYGERKLLLLGQAPGAIQFYDALGFSPRGFHFVCPCGCGMIGGVTVAGDNAWTWNGSRETPSVMPSVLLHGRDGPHWHGYLVEGVWRSC